MSKPTIRFKTEVPISGNALKVPASVSSKIPASGTIEGVIHDFPFRASLEGSSLMLSKSILTAARAKPGESIGIEITKINDELEVRVPADLRKAFKLFPNSEEGWKAITPLARRDWVLAIINTKNEETRIRRIEKACSMLQSGKRRICCFPGLNWIVNGKVKPSETWQKVPKSKN